MWPFILSDRLLIAALVSRYLTNQLIRREPIFQRIAPLIPKRCRLGILCGISSRFQLLSPSERQVAHALLTRSPLSHLGFLTEISKLRASFDLHVLGTPPAFVLSQDQTLKYGILAASPQLKPIRADSISASKELFQQTFQSAVKNPSLVLIRISFCLHCLIYKVHSHRRKPGISNLSSRLPGARPALFCSALSARCLINIASRSANVKSFFQKIRGFFARAFRGPERGGGRGFAPPSLCASEGLIRRRSPARRCRLSRSV